MSYFMVKILINALGENERYSYQIVKAKDKLNASLTEIHNLILNDIYTDKELTSKINNNEAIEDDIFGYRVISCDQLNHLVLNNKDHVIVPTDYYFNVKEPKMAITIKWSLGGYNQFLLQISNSDNLDEALYDIYGDLISENIPYNKLLDWIEHKDTISDISGNYSLDRYQTLKPFKQGIDTYMLSNQFDFNILYETI